LQSARTRSIPPPSKRSVYCEGSATTSRSPSRPSVDRHFQMGPASALVAWDVAANASGASTMAQAAMSRAVRRATRIV